MQSLYKFTILSVLLMVLSGCAKNVSDFRPDPLCTPQIKKNLSSKISVNQVIMPDGDKNSVMCRMDSFIHLPDKKTFSQYIQKAFKSTLITADRLADSDKNFPTLNVKLTKVTFNSVSGKWFIEGQANIDGKAPVEIKTISKYPTAYMAMEACRNTANAFEGAVNKFVNKTLTHPDVMAMLKAKEMNSDNL